MVRGALGVRGDRFAACRLNLDDGNGWVHESVIVIGLDSTLTMVQLLIDFEPEDVDGAIVELNRLHQADAT